MKQKKLTWGLLVALGAFGAVLSTSGSAQAQTYKYPYLEAECPDGAAGAYQNVATDRAGYSGKGHLLSVDNTTAGSFDGSSDDTATYTFELSTKQVYRVYFRVHTGGSGNDDSWYFKLDGYPWTTINNVSGLGNGWVWVEAPGSYLTSAGTHTLEVANREDGLRMDKIAIIQDGTPPPSGLGEPAYNCPVPVHFEAECRTQATEGFGIRHQAKAGFSGTGYLQSRHNTFSTGSSQDTVSYEIESVAAAYTLYFRVHTGGSYDDDSFFYRIDGGTWATSNGSASQGSDWTWVRGLTGFWLSKGKHTIEIANREDGISLDKLALVPSEEAAPSGVGPEGVNCFGDSDDWRVPDVYDYFNGHASYFLEHGAELLERHNLWHTRTHPLNPRILINAAGGITGPGSGVAFLGFHRAIINHFEQYVLEHGGISWESIAVDAWLPYNLGDAYTALDLAGRLDVYESRQSTDLSGIGHPQFLTVDGIYDPVAEYNVVTEGDVTYAALGDIESLDQLGQLIGRLYHQIVHGEINGTMASFYSPADPAFYLWHGRLDRIVDAWLNTPTGRAWQAAHPGHEFLEPGFSDFMDLQKWESDRWATIVNGTNP